MKKNILLGYLIGIVFILFGCTNKEEIKPGNNASSTSTTLKATTEIITMPETTTTKKKTTAKTCTSKKFKNKYTYVYDTEAKCKENGYRDFDNVYDNVNDKVSTFGCEKIVDECGKAYYGVYFNVWSGPGVNDYTKWYY